MTITDGIHIEGHTCDKKRGVSSFQHSVITIVTTLELIAEATLRKQTTPLSSTIIIYYMKRMHILKGIGS
jgi:hypothetical protein